MTFKNTISDPQTTSSPNKGELDGVISGHKGCLFRESRET